jgi:hypothetical protein
MPSHVTHLLFAEEALRAALGDRAAGLLESHGNLFRFGAQGPDFFYHNQRSMPTGLRYGVALHRHGYGLFMAELVREARRLSAGPGSELAAFILGFATHAPLDRRAHPYIGYFSGGGDPQTEPERRIYHAHPFLERILDVLVLRERTGASMDQLDFLSQVRCGKTLPYPVVKAMVKGLNAVYPSYSYKSRDRIRVENAYHDSIFFYKLTNHLNPDLCRLAYKKDRKEGFKQRRLGLIHPRALPADIDFLNLAHAPWCHPCDDQDRRSDSFMDLYQAALEECVGMLGAVNDAISGHGELEEVARRVGNESLDTGRENCAPRFSRPLPLRSILDAMYSDMQREMESASEAVPPEGASSAAPAAASR